MKTKKKKKKYALGTGKNGVVRHYIESPSQTLVENDIAMARAKEKAANNGLAQGLDIFGNMAMQYGMNKAGGSSGVGKGISQGFGNIFGGGNEQVMEDGGSVKGNPGASKKSIKALQKRLKEKGLYTGKIDGIFGPNTQKAYEDFETSNIEEGQESGVVPIHIKSLFNDITGNKNDLTRESLSEDELVALQKIVRKNLSQGRNDISYDDYGTDELPSAKGDAPKKKGKLSLLDKMTDPNYKLKTTLGRANIVTTPTDTLVVDSYDFNDAKKDGGSMKDYIEGLKENPGLYNAARGLGTNFGSTDGEGASAIINTNADQSVEAQLGLVSSFLNDLFGTDMKLGFGMGGKVPSVPVEIEGEEVVETPDGEVFKAKGPSHENGGIDVNLPESTEVFSKRIKVKGKTMAQRKLAREKKTMTLKKLLDKTGDSDIVLKNSLKRTKKNNAMEEEQDQALQDKVGAMKQLVEFAYGTGGKGLRKAYVNGGPILGGFDFESLFKQLPGEIPTITGTSDDFHTGDNSIDYRSGTRPIAKSVNPISAPGTYNDIVPGEIPNLATNPIVATGEQPQLPGEGINLPNFTGGDLLGLAGTAFSAFEPMKNTLANRAGDTPNINAFKDFGNDALDRIDEAKGYVSSQRDKALRDLEIGRTRSTINNRNSARGVNTQRALDLASDVNANNAQSDIYDNFSKNMMNLISQQAGFENQQDQAVMTGEQVRDDNDRRDRDNFYTQMAEDISTKGEGIQTLGKMFNQNKFNTAAEQAVNDSSINFQYSNNGTLTDKAGNVVMSQAELAQAAESMGITVEEYINLINEQKNG